MVLKEREWNTRSWSTTKGLALFAMVRIYMINGVSVGSEPFRMEE